MPIENCAGFVNAGCDDGHDDVAAVARVAGYGKLPGAADGPILRHKRAAAKENQPEEISH